MNNLAHYPVQIFFDGQCPLCRREAEIYQRRDKQGHLELVDIAGPSFDAARYGLDPARVNQVMHVRTADGLVRTQVDAFRTVWRALPRSLGTGLALAFLKVPGALWLANVFYRLFARNRYRLTGRCAAESCSRP